MELLSPGLGYFLWMLVAFLTVMIILRKFAWKPILKMLKDRETGIADALASAEVAKQEMANLKSENEALLQKAAEERTQLLKEAREAGDKIIAEAQEKAKTEYSRIVEDARLVIDQQKNQAMTDVKNKIGDLVIEVSEKILRRQLHDQSSQEALINDFIKDVKLN